MSHKNAKAARRNPNYIVVDDPPPPPPPPPQRPVSVNPKMQLRLQIKLAILRSQR